MKKYKAIITLILALLTAEIAAQNHLIGIKGGINWSNISSDFFQGTDRRGRMTSGITYEYFFKKGFSIGADVIYSPRGFSIDDEISGETFTSEYNYDYIAVPLKFGLPAYGDRAFTFFKVGLIPALLTNAKITTAAFNNQGEFIGKITTDITNRVAEFDLAGLLEAGFGYKATDRLWLTSSIAFQHGLTSISTNDHFGGEAIRHNGFTADIGIKWALKSK